MVTLTSNGCTWDDVTVMKPVEYKGTLFIGLKRGGHEWAVRVSPTGKVVTVERVEFAGRDKKGEEIGHESLR